MHAFVILSDHAHIVLTPLAAKTVERSVQFIKGSFSFLVKKTMGYPGEVWRQSFHDRRIRDAESYVAALEYTHQNPVRRGLCASAQEFRFSSAHAGWEIDQIPQWLKPELVEE